MDCTHVSELISMFIEDEVSPELHVEIAQHLEQCTTCRELKEKIEELLCAFPELDEEVPFFLKNRLYYIPESQKIEELPESRFFYLKWVAAVVGPLIFFLNLFYFTPIYPPANRMLHTAVAKIETLAVDAGAFFDRLKESGSIFGFAPKETNGAKKEVKKIEKKNWTPKDTKKNEKKKKSEGTPKGQTP